MPCGENSLAIMIKNPLTRLPLFVTSRVGTTPLECRNVRLPFGLTRDGSQSVHARLPIEIGLGLNNHNKMIFMPINLHFEDSNLALLLDDFGPNSLLRVTITVLSNQFGIPRDVKNLHITLGGPVELFYKFTIHVS